MSQNEASGDFRPGTTPDDTFRIIDNIPGKTKRKQEILKLDDVQSD